MTHVIYVTDVETTGTDERVHEIIEISLLRMNDGLQKTFLMQPTNFDVIEEAALRVNGHKLEDLKRGFAVDPTTNEKRVYGKREEVLVEIEQFLLDDCVTSPERVLVGHNVQFDIRFIQALWEVCGQKETYPFGRMYIDTMQVAVFLDFASDHDRQGGYHLNGLVKDLEVKKEKAHRADADVRMCRDVLLKQVEFVKGGLRREPT